MTEYFTKIPAEQVYDALPPSPSFLSIPSPTLHPSHYSLTWNHHLVFAPLVPLSFSLPLSLSLPLSPPVALFYLPSFSPSTCPSFNTSLSETSPLHLCSCLPRSRQHSTRSTQTETALSHRTSPNRQLTLTTNTLTLTHSLTHSHAHAHSHTQSHTLTHSHTQTLSHSNTLSHTQTLSLTHMHT